MTTTVPAARLLASTGLVGLLVGCGVVGLKPEPAADPAADPSGADQTNANPTAAAFVLADTDGELIALDDLLAGGNPAVLVFYRGHW